MWDIDSEQGVPIRRDQQKPSHDSPCLFVLFLASWQQPVAVPNKSFTDTIAWVDGIIHFSLYRLSFFKNIAFSGMFVASVLKPTKYWSVWIKTSLLRQIAVKLKTNIASVLRPLGPRLWEVDIKLTGT